MKVKSSTNEKRSAFSPKSKTVLYFFGAVTGALDVVLSCGGPACAVEKLQKNASLKHLDLLFAARYVMLDPVIAGIFFFVRRRIPCDPSICRWNRLQNIIRSITSSMACLRVTSFPPYKLPTFKRPQKLSSAAQHSVLRYGAHFAGMRCPYNVRAKG